MSTLRPKRPLRSCINKYALHLSNEPRNTDIYNQTAISSSPTTFTYSLPVAFCFTPCFLPTCRLHPSRPRLQVVPPDLHHQGSLDARVISPPPVLFISHFRLLGSSFYAAPVLCGVPTVDVT